MIRVLALIAFVGFIVSVACFAGAAAIGGRDIAEHGWRLPADWHIDIDDDDDGDEDRGDSASRTLTWDGGESLTVDLPAEVQFTQAPGPANITVSGPQSLVDRVVVKNGHVAFDQPMAHAHRLHIVMSAPNVNAFTLNGSDTLSIRAYAQDRLAIEISGSAHADAEGTAKAFDLRISGSGEADLSRLASEAGKVDIAGSGKATIAPKTSADVVIAGSGDVTVLGHPTDVRSSISGSGHVIQGGDPA